MNGLSGTAYFQFTVEKDGTISDIATMRGLSYDIETACLNAIQQLPAWHPAQRDGEAIRVRVKSPVKFKLQ